MYYCPGCAVASQKLTFVTQHIELTFLHQQHFGTEGCGRPGCNYCVASGKHGPLARSTFTQDELRDNVYGRLRKQELREAIKRDQQEEARDIPDEFGGQEQSAVSTTDFSADVLHDDARTSLPLLSSSSSSSSSSPLSSSVFEPAFFEHSPHNAQSTSLTTRVSYAPLFSNLPSDSTSFSHSQTYAPTATIEDEKRPSYDFSSYQSSLPLPAIVDARSSGSPVITAHSLRRCLEYALHDVNDMANLKLQDLLRQMRDRWFAETNRQAPILDTVTRAVENVLGPQAELGLFGSNLFGLQVPMSDINLEVKVEPRMSPLEEKEAMRAVHRVLSDVLPTVLMDGARVKTGQVELRFFRPLNVPLAKFIQQAFEADRRAVGLAMLVKTWVKHRALDMCLDGVVWNLFVLHFLQTCPGGPVICAPVSGSQKRPASQNQDSLVSLLFGFFERYSLGAEVPPEYIIGPSQVTKSAFDYEISLKDGAFLSLGNDSKPVIVMRHPCDPSLNLAQSASQTALDVVHAECARAAVLVASLMNLTQASTDALLDESAQARREEEEAEELASVMRQLFERVPVPVPRAEPRAVLRRELAVDRRSGPLVIRKRPLESRLRPTEVANYQRCELCQTDVQVKDLEPHRNGKRHQANLGKRPRLAQASDHSQNSNSAPVHAVASLSTMESSKAPGTVLAAEQTLATSSTEQLPLASTVTTGPSLDNESTPELNVSAIQSNNTSAVPSAQSQHSSTQLDSNKVGPPTQTPEQKAVGLWVCEVCSLSIQLSSKNQHEAGKKHAKKLEASRVRASYAGAPSRPKPVVVRRPSFRPEFDQRFHAHRPLEFDRPEMRRYDRIPYSEPFYYPPIY